MKNLNHKTFYNYIIKLLIYLFFSMATANEPRLAEAYVDKVDTLQVHALPLIQTPGREGSHIEHLLYKGCSMAVFTSGGDSSGIFFIFYNFNFNTLNFSRIVFLILKKFQCKRIFWLFNIKKVFFN